MDYYLLTDMTAQIGYELAAAGAETFRIEETMRRIIGAYGASASTATILTRSSGSTRSRAASAPKRPTPPLPRNGWRRQETIAAAIPFPFITLAIFLPRPASAPSLAEPCATACGRA